MKISVEVSLLEKIVGASDFGDDTAMAAAIDELRELLPDTKCDSCTIGPEGHEFDCPEAQQ